MWGNTPDPIERRKVWSQRRRPLTPNVVGVGTVRNECFLPASRPLSSGGFKPLRTRRGEVTRLWVGVVKRPKGWDGTRTPGAYHTSRPSDTHDGDHKGRVERGPQTWSFRRVQGTRGRGSEAVVGGGVGVPGEGQG